MLFVPSPCEIHRHPGSVVFIASSVRQTPPPAVATQRRHGDVNWHAGEIASAATRPETFSEPTTLVSGPRVVQTPPLAWANPR